MDLAWKSVEELDRLITSCLATNFHGDYVNVLYLIRIAQGIRTDLLEVLVKMESAQYSSCGAILRTAMENSAVMIAITQSDKCMDLLAKGKLKNTSCIGIARKVFDQVGRRYGNLTEFSVHQNFQSMGQNLSPSVLRKRHRLMRGPRHTSFTESFVPMLSENLIYVVYMSYFTLELAYEKRLDTFREVNFESGIVKSKDEGIISEILLRHYVFFNRIKPFYLFKARIYSALGL